jgi:hypothetical protein
MVKKRKVERKEFFFPKVFSDSRNWTKKMSKNENQKKVLGIFAPSLHKKI